ncbi:MAG: ABC transporter permease [Candidatus Omnitrophica bacterium]|nr:ABC transporter permease [Candidatus Omnitrophota bacterium]
MIVAIGSGLTKLVRFTGEFSILLTQAVGLAFLPPLKGHRIVQQAKRVGPESFLIASLVAFFVGMIMALQMAYQMVELSAELYIPNVVAISLTRELAPVLTALIVAGRIGAGITAEIGSMKVSEQVDALRAFAVNPVKYLVVPRMVALVVMLPVLTVFADIIGILGGYVICVYKLHIYPQMYWTMVTTALSISDVVTGLVKTSIFGLIIAIVGCYQGLNVKGGADGVGKATTVSVVISFILIIITDCICTTFIYFILKM